VQPRKKKESEQVQLRKNREQEQAQARKNKDQRTRTSATCGERAAGGTPS